MESQRTKTCRADADPPPIVAHGGWRYHHLGIPTEEPRAGEVYLPHLKLHVAGFETSPYGIEWMRFDPDCDVHELIRRVPHIAFEVDDLEEALRGKTLLCAVSSPSPGVRVAMIIHDGAPIELMQFGQQLAAGASDS